MKRFFKTVVILGVCTVGIVALTHAVLGKQRTRDAASALQKMAQGEVDELIQKQSDMKEELSKLRDDYPRQIAVLKSQLKDIERRLEELDKETRKSDDIVKLCEEDISYLEDQRDTVGASLADQRVIKHRGSRYSLTEADRLIARIGQTRSMYVNKSQDVENERQQLQAEQNTLGVELQELQTEQAEFEVEYQGLLREIERLKRNDEVLKLTQKRKGSQCGKHEGNMETLGQVKGAIERARIEQEERLKSANITPRDLDYETRARLLELQRKQQQRQAKSDDVQSETSKSTLATTK